MKSLEHGFAIVEDCCSPSECDGIISHLDNIACVGTRCLLDNEWCQVLAIVLRNRVVPWLPVIERLVAVQCTYFNKSPTNNWFVAFHQDRSIPVAPLALDGDWQGLSCKENMTFIHGPDELLSQVVAMRLHIDDSTPENGPLRVIPDSHLSGTLSPADIELMRDNSTDCQLTVKRGGVIAMRPLLLHASSKSISMNSRRVLHFVYGPKASPAGLEWRRTV